MALKLFHPIIQRWFNSRFAGPTDPQAKAWPSIREGEHVLIAAPTGSGKTFAAFLSAIDSLFRQAVKGDLADETQVVYVSPLKALSNDIQKNLSEPLEEIAAAASEAGHPEIEIRTLVRTGDTPQSERQAMLKRPPHILVTTPESLYLMLTAERGREMLKSVRTVIVDEIHAVARDKRGSHLSLTLERLASLTGKPLQRIGLSATQKPIEEIGQFLIGVGDQGSGAREAEPRTETHSGPQELREGPVPLSRQGEGTGVRIVDSGHLRNVDLAVEIPGSPLEAVMSAEVWQEIHQRLVELIEQHKTTLIFVNTRRLAERLTANLSEKLGEDRVTAHHGSLSRERRLDAEQRLKNGQLKALVATASLELGIDIGSVDLVCQIGSTRSISTLLQRVGRSGHHLGGTPKGRIFALSRDELIECAALIRATREGRLDRLIIPEKPLDIMAQQIVATAASEEWSEDDLFAMIRRAYPYRDLTRKEFDDTVQMLAEGFTTRRGRRSAYLHYDGVNRRLKGRRGARIAALTSGGAIPDLADYRVMLDPTETFIGTVNEDFAIESMPGDIFQLGNTSWRITKVESGVVRVEDAHGEPPSLPFWLGEAPSRTAELSEEVSRLREDIEARLADIPLAIAWLEQTIGLSTAAAQQIVEYLAASYKVLGVIPSQKNLVLERFFDEAGGMQLVLHSPFGSRINRAWGLSLRKRFCRSFNFELQAAATEDAIVLSLGPQHSFALDEVFQYLHPSTVRDILIQAMLDAPVFPTRWRWNATRALAVLRFRGGRKVPAPLQRMDSDDLVAAVFPDQAACLENIAGDREIPDHPLVAQTIRDCLVEAMDLPGLTKILEGMASGKYNLIARDTPEPSPISHEVINARVYAFLDDAPLEERRTRAVVTRRSLDVKTSSDLGTLDLAAIERVREEAQPTVETPDELHDALMMAGVLAGEEGRGTREEWDNSGAERRVPSDNDTAERSVQSAEWTPFFHQLVASGRATRLRPMSVPHPEPRTPNPGFLWVATERVPMSLAAYPGATLQPDVLVPERERAKSWTREDAIREIVRGQMEFAGPVTESNLATELGLDRGDVEVALAMLEREGFVLRGHFSAGVEEREWCERRLLARIHRYTLDRLRKEIEPVSQADFMRFLFRWQRVAPELRTKGADGLAAVLELLDGCELSASAWESDVLPARVEEYDPLWLDALCLSGEIGWARLAPTPAMNDDGRRAGPIRTTPISLFRREHATAWRSLEPPRTGDAPTLSTAGKAVLETLEQRGASFFAELVRTTGMLRTEVENGLSELVAWGLVSSDSFAGLRALLIPSERRKPIAGAQRRSGRTAPFGVETAGRWALASPLSSLPAGEGDDTRTPESSRRAASPSPGGGGVRGEARDEALESLARQLLRRYGVVFRRMLEREAILPPWRELIRVFWRLEARGEIRGGRFVGGFSGEQFALPEAVGLLRGVRRAQANGELISISGADPLNLIGIVTPGDTVPAITTNRILFRDGVPVAVSEGSGKKERFLVQVTPEEAIVLRSALIRRKISPLVRRYLGKSRSGAA